MRICIWFRTTEAPWGGGNQFLRALSRALAEQGFSVQDTPDASTDVVLVNSHNTGPGALVNLPRLAQLKHLGRMTRLGPMLPVRGWQMRPRKGPAIVHRLDGVAEIIRGVQTAADRIQVRVNRLADLTIFQSVYSRQSFADYGVKPRHWRTIYNGVDPALFYPAATRYPSGSSIRLLAASWSDNPRKGFATLARLSLLPGVQMSFAGRWSPRVDSARVALLGPKRSSDFAEALRSSDAMVHAGENESCSNAILEALACGLPVLYLDSGGNRELAGDYGVPLTEDLASDVAVLRERYTELREKVLADRPRFLISHVAEKYLAAFQQALDLRATPA